MHAIIIDDEKNIREGLKILLQAHPEINVIAEASNVIDGKKQIEQLKPNLVFLDIKLKNSTGFNMLEQLTYKNFKLIFITAYNEYAVKAFKYNAFDYLLKPIDPEELKETLNRLASEKTTYKNQQQLLNTNKKIDRLIVKTTEQIYILELNDIIRCESNQGYTFFYLKNNTRIISSKTLKEYNTILSENQFLRVHQSHLVNTHYIKSYNRDGFLLLKNNEQIPVSIRKRQEIHKYFKR